MTAATKLPTVSRPLILDPHLAAELEKALEPYSGKRLERAQDAIRAIHARGMAAAAPPWQMLATYKAAIEDAAGGG